MTMLFILALLLGGGIFWALHAANERALRAIIRQSAGTPAPRVDHLVRTADPPSRRFAVAGDHLADHLRARRFDADQELLPALWEPPVIHIGRPQLPDPEEIHETRTARASQTVETGFIVPALQAIGTAAAAGIVAGLLAWAAGWSWRVPVVAVALSLALGWLWRLRLADSLLWQLESWTQRDLDNDKAIGNPGLSFTVANPAQARSQVAQETRQEAETAERLAMLAFVDACFTKGCAEAAHGIRAGGPDRQEFVKRRDVLLSVGVARWKNEARPKAGWTLAVSRQRARQILEKHVL